MDSFTAMGHPTGVTLNWVTTSELDMLGFHIYRAESEAGTQSRITTTMIPSQGNPMGGSYEYEDSTAAVGTTYFYWLEAVNMDGSTQRFGPVSATPMVPTAVTMGNLQTSQGTPWLALAGATLVAVAGLVLLRRR